MVPGSLKKTCGSRGRQEQKGCCRFLDQRLEDDAGIVSCFIKMVLGQSETLFHLAEGMLCGGTSHQLLQVLPAGQTRQLRSRSHLTTVFLCYAEHEQHVDAMGDSIASMQFHNTRKAWKT